MVLAIFTQQDMIFYSVLILLAFFSFFGVFLATLWIQKHAVAISPYTGFPLRRASDIPYASALKILQFLYDKHEYDNRIFDLQRAAVCRETGRIFINCITWFDTMHVDWSFLHKRYPGIWVSWGSLTEDQQEIIKDAHESLEGFQTQFSSQKPSPRSVEKEYVYRKPGPLYVEINSKALLGWQCVPETNFEVLIFQKPKGNS